MESQLNSLSYLFFGPNCYPYPFFFLTSYHTWSYHKQFKTYGQKCEAWFWPFNQPPYIFYEEFSSKKLAKFQSFLSGTWQMTKYPYKLVYTILGSTSKYISNYQKFEIQRGKYIHLLIDFLLLFFLFLKLPSIDNRV